MIDSTTFPSTEWFEALAEVMNDNRADFEALGSTDCTMVVQVGESSPEELIEVTFRAYSVASIRRLNSLDEAAAEHFVISASRETWQEMISNIIDHGHPDLEHTLNFLTFPDDPMFVDGPDQLQIDAFYRYNQSLQLFFNGAARVVSQQSAAVA